MIAASQTQITINMGKSDWPSCPAEKVKSNKRLTISETNGENYD
jgi:hypothetical protein